MNDKKLTDKEIVEDLKIYCKGECAYCGRVDEDLNLATDNALDLINRLQAENERLEGLSERLGDDVDLKLKYIYELEEKLETTKAEAYKECIEKVEKIICDNTYPDFDVNHKAVNIWKAEAYKDINNLLKELVGEDNG